MDLSLIFRFFEPEIVMLRPVVFIFLVFLSLSADQTSAETAAGQSETDTLHYISDQLVINIRDQVEKPNAVVGIVRTGDAVRVLEEQSNFAKVETADKKQGWIAKQFLKKDAPDVVLVKQLKEEIAGLKRQLEGKPAGEVAAGTEKGQESGELCAPLQQKLSDAEKQIQHLQEQAKKQAAIVNVSSPAGQSQEQDKEASAQLEETSQRYNQLIIEYEKRGQEIAELQNNMAKQDDTTRFLWFGAGAAVFFLGILAGRSAHRKKNKFLY